MAAELVLGTAQFEKSYGITRKTTGEFDACRLLELATRFGVTSLDTAPAYGKAQELIGSCSWQGAIHTKIPGGEDAQASLKASLLELRRDHVEVAYFHDPDVLQHDEIFFRHVHESLFPEQTEHLGVSVYTPDEFDSALANPFISVIQAPINAIDHRITDEQLEEAASMGKRVYARSIFLQGILLQDSSALPHFLSALTQKIDLLDTITTETGTNRMEVLMQSVLARPGILGIVVGAETPPQMLDIATAFNAPPLDEETRTLFKPLRVDDIDILDPRRWPGSGAIR